MLGSKGAVLGRMVLAHTRKTRPPTPTEQLATLLLTVSEDVAAIKDRVVHSLQGSS
jgi:hypothetical protein